MEGERKYKPVIVSTDHHKKLTDICKKNGIKRKKFLEQYIDTEYQMQFGSNPNSNTSPGSNAAGTGN